jgi:hypothetical protein
MGSSKTIWRWFRFFAVITGAVFICLLNGWLNPFRATRQALVGSKLAKETDISWIERNLGQTVKISVQMDDGREEVLSGERQAQIIKIVRNLGPYATPSGSMNARDAIFFYFQGQPQPAILWVSSCSTRDKKEIMSVVGKTIGSSDGPLDDH